MLAASVCSWGCAVCCSALRDAHVPWHAFFSCSVLQRAQCDDLPAHALLCVLCRSVRNALVYLLTSHSLLLENLALRFLVDVEQPEARVLLLLLLFCFSILA